MIVLCDGMPRSGSTWAFNVALKLLRLCRPDEKTYGGYHEDPGRILEDLKLGHDHLVIKAHCLGDAAMQLARSREVKCIYTHRHPYDAVASSMRMFDIPFEDALSMIVGSLTLLDFHLAAGNACIIAYEAITGAPQEAILGAAAYLGLSVRRELVDQIADEAGLQRVKDFSAGIRETAPGTVRSGKFVYDRESLFHKNHVRDGRSGYGAQLLSREQMETVDARIGDGHMQLMRKLANCAIV